MSIKIITAALPVAFVGTAYSVRAQTRGAETGNLTWGAVGLPTGFSFSSAGVLSALSGALTGTSVGIYPITISVNDTVTTDQVSFDLTVRPAEYLRARPLVLDPRLESLLNLYEIGGLTREEVTAHFRGRAHPSILLESPHSYAADKLVHSASDISFEDISASPVGSPDTRSVKDVIIDLINNTSVITVDSLSDSLDIYTGLVSNAHQFRGLRQGANVNIEATQNDLRVSYLASSVPAAHTAGISNSLSSDILPTLSLPGDWRAGNQDASPDTPSISPIAINHNGAHLYPCGTFSAYDLKRYPHNGHRRIAGESIASHSGFYGYADGYHIAPEAIAGKTLQFVARGRVKIVRPDTFIEFVFEPDVRLSPPVHSPSPSVDQRMVFFSDEVGVSWSDDTYRPCEFSGTVTFSNYNSWQWSGLFTITGLSGQVIMSRLVSGSKTDSNFSYLDGALLGIRYRIDCIANKHIWNNTFQGIGNELRWNHFMIGPQ